jgi:hypothetical protein
MVDVFNYNAFNHIIKDKGAAKRPLLFNTTGLCKVPEFKLDENTFNPAACFVNDLGWTEKIRRGSRFTANS